MYGILPRVLSELRDLEKSEFRSANAKDFAAGMQELHNKIKE